MAMQRELESLNPPQRQAVEHVHGRLLILAGAGSGKTRVLTDRMAYLIRELGISPKAILGLTFTNKAAAEMRHRLSTYVEAAAANQVTLCTFHSFCMQVLRHDIEKLGYTKNIKDIYEAGNILFSFKSDYIAELKEFVTNEIQLLNI